MNVKKQKCFVPKPLSKARSFVPNTSSKARSFLNFPLGNEKIKCIECGSGNVVSMGVRKNKRRLVQRYKCRDCNKIFSLS